MNHGEQVWRLMQGEELPAELIVTGWDFPWLNARIRAMPGFEAARPLFGEELRALGHIDDDVASWQAAYDRIREAVSPHNPEGRPVPEVLLHVDGKDAWCRGSDESVHSGRGGNLIPATLTLIRVEVLRAMTGADPGPRGVRTPTASVDGHLLRRGPRRG